MVRLRPAAVLFGAALALGAVEARAQFGSIFGSGPPRPPASVPGADQQGGPTYQPAPPSYPPSAPNYQQPPGGRGAAPGAVQSQPLAPPPGAAAAAPASPQPTLSGLPPGSAQPPNGQRPPPRGTQPSPLPPDAAGPPNDQIVAEPPAQKIVNNSAMFSGLDKITGRIINFDVAIGETVQFGALQVTPRACYTRPATETQNTDAFVEVDEVTLQGEVKRIFSGWMYASSPGLHGVEHAVYDVWLTNCKSPAQTVSATPDPPPAATPTPTRPAQPQRQPAQQRQPRPPAQNPPPR